MMHSPGSPNPIHLSVIVPSYNRCGPLSILLEAFMKQTLSSWRFEVIIVLDGSSDGSNVFLQRWSRDHPEFPMRFFEQPNQGQSKARSRGAMEARAPILLFLDDDIVPEPRCLEAHLECHQQAAEPSIVLGDARITRNERETYYDLVTRMWWEDMYAERAQRFPYSTYRDFCSGHVSLPRDQFWSIGGFDEDFQSYGGEDYDLGYRLLKAGTVFLLEPQARATHQHLGNPRQVFRNLISEGKNDVRLGHKHPELRRGLRCARESATTRLFFTSPFLFHITLSLFPIILDICERLRLWSTWRWLFGKLRHVAYWIGVTKGCRNWKDYCDFIDTMLERPSTVLDITDGLPKVLSSIWMHGPSTIRIKAKGNDMGLVELDAIPRGHLASHLAEIIANNRPAGLTHVVT